MIFTFLLNKEKATTKLNEVQHELDICIENIYHANFACHTPTPPSLAKELDSLVKLKRKLNLRLEKLG